MAEITPEMELVRAFKDARRRRDAHRVWQGLGAFADSYRTGMSGAQALALRAPEKDYISESEKVQMLSGLGEKYEAAERAYGLAGMEQVLGQAGLRLRGLQANLEAELRNRGISADSARDRANATFRSAQLAQQRLEEGYERMMRLDPQSAKLLGQALQPSSTQRGAIAALVMQNAGIQDTGEGLVGPDGEPLSKTEQSELAGDIEQALDNVLRGNYPRGFEDYAQQVHQQYQQEKAAVLEDTLRNLPSATPGDRVKMLEAAAMEMGVPADQLLARFQDKELASDVAQDRKMRDGEIAARGADLEQQAVIAANAARRLGANDRAVQGAVDAVKQATSALSNLSGGLAPEAPPTGGPGFVANAPAPQGQPMQQAAPQGQPETDPTDPKVRHWHALGFQGAPPTNGLEYLSQMMQRIEELPTLPAVERTRKALESSPQYQEWLKKNGYGGSEVAFRQFVKETQKKARDVSRQDAMRTRERQRLGELERGPWSIHAGEKFAAPEKKQKKTPRVIPPPVQGADTGAED